MKQYRTGLFALIFLMLLMRSTCVTSTGFTVDPLFTDTIGDHSSGESFTDIIDVWIDNTATHIRFKLKLAAPFNQSIASTGFALYAHISVDNTTGISYAGLNVDYTISLYSPGDVLAIYFHDNIGAQDLTDAIPGGLAYYAFSDNNHTWEFGYKLKTYSGGKGYLNLSAGQLIYVRFEGGGDTDYAPNETAEPLGYVVESVSTGIPGFTLLLLSSTLIAIGALSFLKKKTIKL